MIKGVYMPTWPCMVYIAFFIDGSPGASCAGAPSPSFDSADAFSVLVARLLEDGGGLSGCRRSRNS
jgi:hypothetical protein